MSADFLNDHFSVKYSLCMISYMSWQTVYELLIQIEDACNRRLVFLLMVHFGTIQVEMEIH